MDKVELFCNNEVAYINGKRVGDYGDSLYDLITNMLYVLDIDYDEVEELK